MTKNKLVSLLSPAAFLLFGIWIKVSTLLRVLACVAAMFLYVFLLKKIGFFLDTVLLGAFIMWVLGYQRYKILAACAVGIAAVVFGVFYGLLNVPLPTLFL